MSLLRKCTICNIEKELIELNFRHRDRSKNTYFNKCKVCEKQHREENKEKILKDKAEYRKNNKDKIKESSKKHYEENKDNILIKQAEYNSRPEVKEKNRQKQKEKRKDPKERLHHNISNSIRQSFKSKNINKNSAISKCLNYSMVELKEYLEYQFEWWMTWDNYGVYKRNVWKDNDPATWTWQVDHIEPHSDFEYTSEENEEFKECWALENLRPYSAKQNVLDGTGRTRHKKKDK